MSEEDAESISKIEIVDEIKTVKVGKAAGHDRITPEMIRYVGETRLERYTGY